MSDINSGTDADEFLKKFRKVRAAKMFDDDTSNDEESDDAFFLELPKIPQKHVHTKNAKLSQTGKSIIK